MPRKLDRTVFGCWPLLSHGEVHSEIPHHKHSTCHSSDLHAQGIIHVVHLLHVLISCRTLALILTPDFFFPHGFLHLLFCTLIVTLFYNSTQTLLVQLVMVKIAINIVFDMNLFQKQRMLCKGNMAHLSNKLNLDVCNQLIKNTHTNTHNSLDKVTSVDQAALYFAK